MPEQPSCTVSVLGPQPVKTDKCVGDVVASFQVIHQTGGLATVHAQTLLPCLNHKALDRLRVRLNVILFERNILFKAIKTAQLAVNSVRDNIRQATTYALKN